MLPVIDETLPIPFHVQLADILRRKIRAGEYKFRLPSINTLSQEYEVSRNTVLHALENLGRRLVLVHWDSGITVPVFPDEIALESQDSLHPC